jgi:hypothetical protein
MWRSGFMSRRAPVVPTSEFVAPTLVALIGLPSSAYSSSGCQ